MLHETVDDINLIMHGYEPIMAIGKRPIGNGWQERPVAAIARERHEHPHANTGLRTGHLVGLDIDVTDPGVAEQVKELVQKALGHTPLQRVGSKGAMLCYRNETPIPKMSIVSAGVKLVEILGVGQQFIAYGTHPVTGKPYEWVSFGDPLTVSLAALPEVTPEKLAECAQACAALLTECGHVDVRVSGGGMKPEPRARAVDEIDTDERKAKVRELAAGWEPATNPGGSNDATIELANRLLDLCSYGIVVDAMLEYWMPRCSGEWTEGWVREKVESLKPGTGRDSDIGCEVYPIEYGYLPDAIPDQPGPAKLRKRFEGMWPDEYAKVPFPIFWDLETKMIPKKATGATVLVSGQWGSHKTNVTLTWLMDMVEAGARVLYAAGEGDIEVGKVRIPAHCAARGIDIKSLRGKLMLCPAVPLLRDKEQVEAFVAEYHEFAPNVVVIDTLATATAGENENGSEFSGHLTDNGAVGFIKREFKATVMVIAHEGKDPTRGARGHSGLMGNVDAGLSVTCAEGAARIDVFVDKMRGGRGKFHTYYAVDPASLTDNDVIPVPKLISPEQYKAMAPKREPGSELLLELAAVLGPSEKLTTPETAKRILTARMEGEEPTAEQIRSLQTHILDMARKDERFAAYKMGTQGQACLWGVHPE